MQGQSVGQKGDSTPCETEDLACCFWLDTDVKRSPVDRQSLALTMLASQFTGALAKIGFLDSKASISIHMSEFKRRPVDDQLQGGTIIQRLDVSVLEDNSSLHKFQISWETSRLSDESNTEKQKTYDFEDSGNYADDDVNLFPWTSFITVERSLQEKPCGSESTTMSLMNNPSKETALVVQCNFHPKEGKGDHDAHYIILASQSAIKAHRQHHVLKHFNLSIASCGDALPSVETRGHTMRIKLDPATEFRKPSLEFLAHGDLEESFKSSGNNQIRIQSQNQRWSGLATIPSNYYISRKGEPQSTRNDITRPDRADLSHQMYQPGSIKMANNIDQSSPAGSTADSTRQSSAQYKTTRKPFKRPRDGSEQFEDEKLKKRISSQTSSEKELRPAQGSGLLACPFYKRDPWRFHLCLNYRLSKICYVKQHLVRCHIANSKSDGSQTTFHIMTADQHRDIQLATRRNVPVENQWYQIWSILFPGVGRPDSPHVKEHVFAEALSSIRAFCRGAGSHIVTETFRQANNSVATAHDIFDQILNHIENRTSAYSSEQPSISCLDDNVGTERTYYPDFSGNHDQHNTGVNNIAQSASSTISRDYGATSQVTFDELGAITSRSLEMPSLDPEITINGFESGGDRSDSEPLILAEPSSGFGSLFSPESDHGNEFNLGDAEFLEEFIYLGGTELDFLTSSL